MIIYLSYQPTNPPEIIVAYIHPLLFDTSSLNHCHPQVNNQQKDEAGIPHK